MEVNTLLILSSHRALHGAIPKNLKGLKSKIVNKSHLQWICYFDQEPTEEEKDRLSDACTEVIADFPLISSVDEQYLYHPEPLNMEGSVIAGWAFFRWEPN
ncbi:hypothetical protein ACERII_24620 [Evansella sp. AB-rgal1]|uniref:hypothetical protein n=1 Tax=Evansella sp. AB-rgal1 TaxID=3242696 RepID=UPI00359CC4B8